MATQINNRNFGDEKGKRMIDAKSMLPDRFGTPSGPGWKAWRKEMLEYVGYFRPRMSMAMTRAEQHKVEVEFADHVELNITQDDDHETRVLLVNRCTKGTPAGDIMENHIDSPALELWRKIVRHYDPIVENRKLEATMQVLSPGKDTNLAKLGR